MPSKSKAKDIKKLPKFVEEERMSEIYLLLGNLFEREEVTIQSVLDRLYDIGSVNLINQRVRLRFFNYPVQSVARLSKPAFKILAIRWFKRNCPTLVTEWLYKKVLFEPVKPKILPRPLVTSSLVTTPVEVVSSLENRTVEVKQLRSQVKLLTGSLILITAVLGGTVVWMGYNLQNLRVTAETPQTFDLSVDEQ